MLLKVMSILSSLTHADRRDHLCLEYRVFGGLDQSMTKRENLLVTDDRVLLSHKTKSFLPCFL